MSDRKIDWENIFSWAVLIFIFGGLGLWALISWVDEPKGSPSNKPSQQKEKRINKPESDTFYPETKQNEARENLDEVNQSYWYCWDTGDPDPHHLGYPVNNDHLCTDGELLEAGML